MATCEFYYRQIPEDQTRGEYWELISQSWVCETCQYLVAEDGGYAVVKGGAYADGPDPREAKRDA